MEDIKTNVPVFSKNHALAILEIINEVCNDIDERTLTDPDINFDNDLMVTEFEELFGSCSYSDFPPDLTLDPDALLDWLFQMEMEMKCIDCLNEDFPKLALIPQTE